MKIVLDTNVLISATFHGGVPLEVVKAARQGVVTVCVTAEIIAEYHAILLRFFGPGSEPDVAVVLNGLLMNAMVVAPMALPNPVAADPDDDKFIACALAAGADFIVSGDKHLLGLHGRIPIPVLRPRDALARIP